MKLLFLGSGSAFTVGGNYHSNMVLQHDDGQRLMIDCGSDARFSLNENKLSYKDINDVYISHLHADHCGGLEWLGYSRKFDRSCSKPILRLQESLVLPLWENVLKGGMQTLTEEEATLESFFEVKSFKDTFEWKDTPCKAIQTVHVFNQHTQLPSFGLQIGNGSNSVLITTDTQFRPDILTPFYESSALIFHDCETSKQRSSVHAHYEDLRGLPTSIKRKMWLYHYNPGPLPDAEKDGFRGFVKRGQFFDVLP